MKTLCFLTQKGGSGKSTLAINCAVHGQLAGKKVLLIDADPQATAKEWYKDRPESLDAPMLVHIAPSEVPEALEKAKKGGFDVVIVDTPGRDSKGTKVILSSSDMALIPCRPTVGDLRASVPTALVAKGAGKEFAFILNQTPPHPKRSDEAALSLRQIGNVCPVYIRARTAYQDAQIRGLGVDEFEPKGTATGEITSLWDWIDKHCLNH